MDGNYTVPHLPTLVHSFVSFMRCTSWYRCNIIIASCHRFELVMSPIYSNRVSCSCHPMISGWIQVRTISISSIQPHTLSDILKPIEHTMVLHVYNLMILRYPQYLNLYSRTISCVFVHTIWASIANDDIWWKSNIFQCYSRIDRYFPSMSVHSSLPLRPQMIFSHCDG